jgi:hypothetical protein
MALNNENGIRSRLFLHRRGHVPINSDISWIEYSIMNINRYIIISRCDIVEKTALTFLKNPLNKYPYDWAFEENIRVLIGQNAVFNDVFEYYHRNHDDIR